MSLLFPKILLLLLFSYSNGSVNMLLFWGYPTSDTQYCTFENGGTFSRGDASFADCITLCLGSETCMLAYGSDGNCNLCDIYAVSSITHSDSTNGIQIAVKVDPLLGCPVDIRETTYTRTDTPDSYSMSYSGPTWDISYDKKCLDTTWRTFMRPSGGICIKVFSMPTGRIGLNNTDSAIICDGFGANYGLSGMQNVIEKNYIYDTAKVLIGDRPELYYSTVWLNGRMRPHCYPTPTPSDCVGITAFENFPYQDNFDAYIFPTGFPNFTKQYPDDDLYNSCLQLNIAQSMTAYDGLVTNPICELNCNGGIVICATAYACQGPAV